MMTAVAEGRLAEKKKRVVFEFGDPDSGWVHLTVMFDDEPVYTLSLTNVWGDPVQQLLQWLERIASEQYEPQCLHHDGEGRDYVFMFERMLFPTDEIYDEDNRYYDYGLFSVYGDGCDRLAELVWAVCDTDEFVEGLYASIQDFARRLKQNGSAVRRWGYGFLSQNEHGLKRMLDNLRSDMLDQYFKKGKKDEEETKNKRCTIDA